MRFWTNCFFSFNIFFLPKKKSKRCERNTKSSNTQGFKLHRPSSKGTKLFSVKIIKAIIIITNEIHFWAKISIVNFGVNFSGVVF